jgi:hypothetical protein
MKLCTEKFEVMFVQILRLRLYALAVDFLVFHRHDDEISEVSNRAEVLVRNERLQLAVCTGEERVSPLVAPVQTVRQFGAVVGCPSGVYASP